MNACISQLRFFTIYVLHKPWDPTQIPFRKFDAYLPYVPSQKEVFFFIDSFSNLKHKAIAALMYSAGLRIGEICRLRYGDVSRSSMLIHVRSSKNRSDRFAILSKSTLDILTCYWFEYGRPSGFLFPNRGFFPLQRIRLLFSARGKKPEEPKRRITLDNTEFIQRYLMRVLPCGFQKICYYGFLNNRMKAQNLKVIFKLQNGQRFKQRFAGLTMAELIKAVRNFDICLCPKCGHRTMKQLGRCYAPPS